MTIDRFDIAPEEGEALRARILSVLDEKPPQTLERIAAFADRRVWDEMHAEGFIGDKMRDELNEWAGSTLAQALDPANVGHIRRSTKVGRKTMAVIRDFVTLNYDFVPELDFNFAAGEIDRGVEADESSDVAEIDAKLTEIMTAPLDFAAAGVKDKAAQRAVAAGVETVGDFLASGRGALIGPGNAMTETSFNRLRAAIEEAYDISYMALKRNPAVTEAVRWKRAVIRVTTPE